MLLIFGINRIYIQKHRDTCIHMKTYGHVQVGLPKLTDLAPFQL